MAWKLGNPINERSQSVCIYDEESAKTIATIFAKEQALLFVNARRLQEQLEKSNRAIQNILWTCKGTDGRGESGEIPLDEIAELERTFEENQRLMNALKGDV